MNYIFLVKKFSKSPWNLKLFQLSASREIADPDKDWKFNIFLVIAKGLKFKCNLIQILTPWPMHITEWFFYLFLLLCGFCKVCIRISNQNYLHRKKSKPWNDELISVQLHHYHLITWIILRWMLISVNEQKYILNSCQK